MSDDVTPEAARRRLLSCDNAMTAAELDLRRARDAEVEALHTYQASQRRAMLSEECPAVTRGSPRAKGTRGWTPGQRSTRGPLTWPVCAVSRPPTTCVWSATRGCSAWPCCGPWTRLTQWLDG